MRAADASARGLKQLAYRVVVAASPEALDALCGDSTRSSATPVSDVLWDCGKVESRQTLHVVYAGTPLASRQRCHWKVCAFDSASEPSWSDAAWFELGILEPTADAWRGAKWIEPDLPPVRAEPRRSAAVMSFSTSQTPPETRLTPCSMLRREFAVRGPVRRARAYATAHGIYALEINGRRADDREFAPEFTPYRTMLCVQTYDVAPLLAEGPNALGVTVADGWWAGRVGMSGDALQYGDRHGLLLLLEIEYEDGTTERVVSDEKWRCSTGPLVYSDIFVGEMYDARLEVDGWSSAGFDASGWKGVKTADQHGYANLVPQQGPPVRAIATLPCTDIITTPKGETVLDFGQVIAGRIKMKVRGEAGTKIVMEHSEVLDREGNYFNNILGRNKDQCDVYICRGGGEEEYEARFTYHGFRYVRLTGYPGTPSKADFAAVAYSSDLEPTGTFTSSSPELTKLQQNIVWSQRGNFLSIPTDCPQRERAGWTGDIQIFGPTACFNLDSDAFLARWMDAVAADQLPDGQVPHVVPYLDAYRELVGKSLGSDSSAAWGDACIAVPLQLYLRYGDRRALERHWPVMEKWLAYIDRRAANHASWSYYLDPRKFLSPSRRAAERYLWNTGWHFGDWLAPSQCWDMFGAAGMFLSAFPTRQFVASAQYAESTKMAARVAEVLGMDEKAAHYRELSGKIREAFVGEHVDKRGRLSPHLQGTYVIALKFGLVPEHLVPAAVANLVSLLEANEHRLDTGFVSVPHLLDVLCDHGRRDVAAKVLHQRKCPGWLFEVDNGATTMWESWKAVAPDGTVSKFSFNHFAFGCVGDWIYRKLGGVHADVTGIRIAPKPDGVVTSAETRFESAWGRVACRWKLDGGRMELVAEVPVNAEATVVLPGADPGEVVLDGKPLAVPAKKTTEGTEMVVGSGTWTFSFSFPGEEAMA
ncbi:alpha-L-rhamnosidase [Hyaloraphidium curvatum]|nr:alpha-L-rhamnosidase [Hyaloraphidium curvatum]